MEWGFKGMNNLLHEKNLCFDFSKCSLVNNPVKFDIKNPGGMTGVDFVAETDECIYFIEVKDFQNPRTSKEHQIANYEMLVAISKSERPRTSSQADDKLAFEKGRNFCLSIGMKIKDSLLRKYAMGEEITKDVVYLFVLNLDSLGKRERGILKERINNGYIPTGLNDNQFTKFKNIRFDLVNTEQLKIYNITCTVAI